MKNETGLHFLGWMILSNVANTEFSALAASVIAGGYAVYGIYECWRDRK